MDIVITGSIAYDYLMRFPGRFKEHVLPDSLDKLSVSFLVDDMTRHWGGVGANISYTLGLLGHRPRLLGTVGKDFSDYRNWLDAVGVDTSSVVVINEVFTASFFVNTDLENNQIASFYGGAMFYAKHHGLLETVKTRPDYVVISPNDPTAMINLAEECHTQGIPFMYDPSQQLPRLDGDTVRQNIERCHSIVVNEYEWEMLTKKTGMTRDEVLNHVKVLIITHGKAGAVIYADGEKYDIPVFPIPDSSIVDPTGAGDGFRAGILRGMALGWPWDVAGRSAALCAAYVLENVGPQGHKYTPADFVARYRTAFDDRGIMDSLITSSQTVRG